MKKRMIKDINVLGKRVLVRVDFNVTVGDGFRITDETRIVEALPTIRYLLGSQAKVILASHLGRPKGKVDARYSLKPVVKRLEEHLGRKVKLIDQFWQKTAKKEILALANGEIVMLENIRFHPGEEKNDRAFAKHLASFADYFVNDAFGTSHRAHASVVGIAEILPAYAGFLLEKEIDMISMALGKPKRPLVIVIGGAKTPEKIRVIDRLLDLADTILLGGAAANTFLRAWGFTTGTSLVDHEMIEMAKVVSWKASHKHCALLLPSDVVVSDAQRKKPPQVVSYDKITANAAIYDIGPNTIKKYVDVIASAGTVIWNGPMGFYEHKRFRTGTDAILESIVSTNALTIVGGGDTLASINRKDLLGHISHLSTGGGAMLEYLEKGTLPGIEIIQST